MASYLDNWTPPQHECISCKSLSSMSWHSQKAGEEYCRDCWFGYTPRETSVGGSFTKEDTRASHWRDIQTRVLTHEGETLSGQAGVAYQQKWSRQYLGKDLSQARRADRGMVEQYKYQNGK